MDTTERQCERRENNTETFKYKVLKFFTRKFKGNKLAPPQDLKDAFSNFAIGGAHMSADQLRRFLAEHQDEAEYSLSDSEHMLEKFLQMRSENNLETTHTDQCMKNGLDLDDMFHFLLSDEYNGPLKSEVHHDMEAPLSHYFIYTGHNSYLTGNQLSSDCSDVPIKKALLRGVRAIELDLWPTSNKDDIKVVHGWTFTHPVSPIKCLESIKKYAFVASQYPVIITIEDHLTRDLRPKFAKMATQILGDMLYYPEGDFSTWTEFPSPESLKNKIIISTKPPKDHPRSNSINVKEEGEKSNHWVSDNESESSEEETWGKESPESLTEQETEERSGSDQDERDVNSSFDSKPCHSLPAAPDYKRLITIHVKKLKGSLKEKLTTEGELRRLSWSEQTLEKATESHGTDIVRFTRRNILRVYPKGTRVQSSNFKPHLGWMYGAQMVAFNMQGHGKKLRLMQGMFRANGGCGYVKKPQILMQKREEDEDDFDPQRTLPVKMKLKVKVYLGVGWSSDFGRTHFDACSPPDFYTKICIVGVPNDCASQKTKVIMDDWFPVWNDEFEFPLTVPDLALLRIVVKEKDQGKDDFGGQTCLPVSELRRGFRSVPLHNKKGEKYKSVRLFMRFQFE